MWAVRFHYAGEFCRIREQSSCQLRYAECRNKFSDTLWLKFLFKKFCAAQYKLADCNKNLQRRRWKIKNFQPLIENAADAAEYEEIMEKKLIIFTDSGDTLIDEGSQIFDENGIVTSANLIEEIGRAHV